MFSIVLIGQMAHLKEMLYAEVILSIFGFQKALQP